MLEETPTNRPRLLGREKQTPKTGAHTGAEKRCGKEEAHTGAEKKILVVQKIYANVVPANGPAD